MPPHMSGICPPYVADPETPATAQGNHCAMIPPNNLERIAQQIIIKAHTGARAPDGAGQHAVWELKTPCQVARGSAPSPGGGASGSVARKCQTLGDRHSELFHVHCGCRRSSRGRPRRQLASLMVCRALATPLKTAASRGGQIGSLTKGATQLCFRAGFVRFKTHKNWR